MMTCTCHCSRWWLVDVIVVSIVELVMVELVQLLKLLL